MSQSATQADLTERFRPTDAQIAAAVAALAEHPDWIAAVPLVLPGKEYGWWTVGQTVEHADGVWVGANSFDVEPSYSTARNDAADAARAALGDRPGTVAYASVHADGTWAVFEDFRTLDPEPAEADTEDEPEEPDTYRDGVDGHEYVIRYDRTLPQIHARDCDHPDHAEPDSLTPSLPGGVTRYFLVEVDLADGSHGTPNPEKAVETLIEKVRKVAGHWKHGADDLATVTVEQVHPGDVVAGDDVPEPESGSVLHAIDAATKAWEDVDTGSYSDLNDAGDELAEALDAARAWIAAREPASGLPLLTAADVAALYMALEDARGYREDDEACDLHECDPVSESPCVGDVWTVCPARRAAIYSTLIDRFDAAARA